jgi:hypothetical protein
MCTVEGIGSGTNLMKTGCNNNLPKIDKHETEKEWKNSKKKINKIVFF